MSRKKWVLISLAVICFSTGLIYGILSYYHNEEPISPPVTEGAPAEGSGDAPHGVEAENEPKDAAEPSGEEMNPGSQSKYIGVQGGFVAVFTGKPSEGKVERLTDISADSLPKFEQDNLRSGIRVDSDEELVQILEGLSGS